MGTIKRTFANSLTGTGKLSATNLDSNIPANNIADASVTNVTTLPESLGQAIKSVAGSPPSLADGDIWYNTITGTLKNYATVSAAWASGGNLNSVKMGGAGCGTQTATLVFGGNNPPPTINLTGKTEEYNGTSWSEQNDLNTIRQGMGGAGTQTAGLSFAGRLDPPTSWKNESEEYNGTSWTEGNNVNTARVGIGGTGTQTAALGFGGEGPTTTSNTEEYNGTSWTEVNNLNTAKEGPEGAGTQTAALGFGGYVPGSGASNLTEEYDGTSWTSGGAMGTGRYSLGGGGTQTAAIAFGGNPGRLVNTELYDGTSWTTTSDLATGRGNLQAGNAAPNTASIAVGGRAPIPVTPSNTAGAFTEEFTGAFNAIRTVTTS